MDAIGSSEFVQTDQPLVPENIWRMMNGQSLGDGTIGVLGTENRPSTSFSVAGFERGALANPRPGRDLQSINEVDDYALVAIGGQLGAFTLGVAAEACAAGGCAAIATSVRNAQVILRRRIVRTRAQSRSEFLGVIVSGVGESSAVLTGNLTATEIAALANQRAIFELGMRHSAEIVKYLPK